MTIARAHTQLSLAIRSLSQARTQLQTGRLTWIGRLLYRYRCILLASRIRRLVHELHSASSTPTPTMLD